MSGVFAGEEQQVPPLRLLFPSGSASFGRDDSFAGMIVRDDKSFEMTTSPMTDSLSW